MKATALAIEKEHRARVSWWDGIDINPSNIRLSADGGLSSTFGVVNRRPVASDRGCRPSAPRIYLDGEPPGAAHGTDVDDRGDGTVTDPRLYQLIRQPGAVTERTFEITFLDPGVQAYAFTFG